MKRGLILVALAAIVVAPAADAGHATSRSESGTIQVPTANTGSPVSRQGRCAYTVTRDITGNGKDADGLVAWVVELTAAEGDGTHTFSATSQTPGADVQVIFYASFGSCDNDPAPVTPGNPFQALGDESGTIPATSRYAMVVYEGAVSPANFTFTVN